MAAAQLLVAALVVAPVAGVPGPWPTPIRAAATCTGWQSDSVPPTSTRILRTVGPAAGSVQVVPFHTYVNVVMAAEWGPSNPAEALKAGAVAIKEYAWYHTMFWRGGKASSGACYDLVDSSMDQVYWPEARTPSASHLAAVEASWGISVRKSTGLFPTHYDAGASVACGANANGWQLLQVSAVHCAQDGMTAEAILQTYYGPGLVIVGGSPPPSTLALSFRAQPADGTAGVALPVQPALAIVDAAGQDVTTGSSSTLVVSLALGPSTSGALLTCNGGLSRAAVGGVATFDGCLLSVADPGAVLVASAPGLASVSSAPFAVAPGGPVSTAPAPLLTIDAAGTPTLRGMDVRLAAQLVPPGAEAANGRVLHLERSADGVHWTGAADLTTDAAGFVGGLERPATNTWYRVTFDGAPDLAPTTSPALKVLVPRVALLRPDSKGVVRRVQPGTAVSFATFVRPTPPSAAAGRVEYRLVQRVGRVWVVRHSWSASVDLGGWARLRITFATKGTWAVQVRALATAVNSTSAWSTGQRYDVL